MSNTNFDISNKTYSPTFRTRAIQKEIITILLCHEWKLLLYSLYRMRLFQSRLCNFDVKYIFALDVIRLDTLTLCRLINWVGVNKQYSSAPFISPFRNIIQTPVPYGISRYYLTGVAAAAVTLDKYERDAWVITNIFAKPKSFLKEILSKGVSVTPTPDYVQHVFTQLRKFVTVFNAIPVGVIGHTILAIFVDPTIK